MELVIEPAKELPILALNCGSSSLKFGLYSVGQQSAGLLFEGTVEEIGSEHSKIRFKAGGEAEREERAKVPDLDAALERALQELSASGAPDPAAVGHRIVHGGPQVRDHGKIDDSVLQKLKDAVGFAPLHLPAALSVVEAMRKRLPQVPQVACLDTAFHRTMPDVSKTYALPAKARALGVERYGFHGLSLESILAQMNPVPSRLVVAHLGNGASITAIKDGQSVDTSMGLTPSGGMMMGTRSGDLDPGVLTFLMRNGFANDKELERLFDHESGLLGVSEQSSDVRELLQSGKENGKADLALRMFCYQARKTIGEMTAALGGIDCLVFTGGIGEHAREIRDEICSGLGFLQNLKIAVLPAQEDLQIAKNTWRLSFASA